VSQRSYPQLLLAVAAELGQVAAAWRGLGSAVVRSFLLQDLGAIVRPCAPVMLLGALAVAGLGLSFVLRAMAAVNSAIAGDTARLVLVDCGPLFSAILLVGVVLPLRVAALRAAAGRGDYLATTALGFPLARILGLPSVAAHALAAALGAVAWLAAGLIVAPSVNAVLGAARWLDQERFLLLAISPLDSWRVALHGLLLGAVVGACGLVAARVRDGGPQSAAAEPGAEAARSVTQSLVLAVLAIASAEILWWFLRWLSGGQ
jgi:hypothetical protein